MNALTTQGLDLSAAIQGMAPDTLQKFQTRMEERCLGLAREVIQNYPEYSSEWIRCTNWGKQAEGTYYQKMTFKVSDQETDCERFDEKVIDVDTLAPAVFALWLQNEAGTMRVMYNKGDDFWDGGNWDANSTDLLLQVYFYGEVVYG